jgi:hypothetical protein
MENLGPKTSELAALVQGKIARINQLEGEKIGATGDLKNAIELLIKDNVWKIQQAIGTYWRESLDITMPTTATFLTHPYISGNF